MVDVAREAAVEDARRAFAAQDWQRAYDLVAPTAAEPDAEPEAIELLADAAWWLGHLEECAALRERAYHLRLEAGATRRAARLASLLYYDHCWQARRVVANGWLARAGRLLADEPECPEHGYVLVLEAENAHGDGDLDTAAAKADAAAGIGRRHGVPDLEADALQCHARVLIAQGKPADGLALFDEAMLLAVEGKLALFAQGKVYCSLISACEELADFQRAIEWTKVGNDWAAPQMSPVFPGLCRVHQADVLKRRGAWDEAEAEARRACDELCDVNRFNTGLAYYEIGEIRRRLGDLDGADQAFRDATEYGADPQPGLALLRLAQGRHDVAAAGIARAIADTGWNRLARAKLLPAQVDIAIETGDLATARAAVEELEDIAATYNTVGLRALAVESAGRVALAEGDHATACRTLRRALHEWQALDLPYEVASTRVRLARACRLAGDEDGALGSFDAAIAIFQRLGATTDLAATVELRDGPAGPLPGGLTAREAEVLRLVAAGHTNREVADALHLSTKTVARHLSNIFAKTGVTSRAGATAYAFEHGIVGTHA